MNAPILIPLDLINAAICVALSIHGVCTINHFSKSTPCFMRIGVAIFTVGCVGVAIGPFYGVVTSDPLEVVMNAGLLIYCLRKELYTYMSNRSGRR